jgi:DNA topoisomerase
MQGKTSPPDYLTEADLIGLMEQHGIGTDASISVHVHNVCERGYLRVEAGRRVVPTDLGITLISGYQRIDPELCRPQVLLLSQLSVSGASCCRASPHCTVSPAFKFVNDATERERACATEGP